MEFSIDDKGSLETAVIALGLRYNHGQTQFRGYGDSMDRCEDAISVPNKRDAYEIGVVSKSTGGYDLLWDNFNGGNGLCDYVGRDGKRLQDEYNAAFLTKQYETDGYSVSRTNAEDGRILLEAYR